MRLTASEAQTLAEQTLERIGYDAEEARIIAEHVLDAALCGYEYSGLPKILNVAEHRQLRQPRRPMRALRETPVSALFDGGNNNGMVAMQALGVLAGSGLGDDKTYGYLIMAIKPDLLLPLDEYRRDMSAMLARVKATPRQPGVDEIRMPGERAFRERERNRREGIEIDRKIYDALLALPKGKLPEL